ncbi:UNVERIFIED_ORG: hypothetical protein J3D58_002636 [Paenarthrobacter nicotinovorans]
MNPLTMLLRRSFLPDPSTLLNRWKEQSLQTCWRYEEDWDVPETRNLVMAASGRHGLREASMRLGYCRSLQGVGITEIIEDLRSFYAAIQSRAAADILQSLAEGWVAASESTNLVSCTDPLTGLSTSAHFKRVLHDTHEGTPADPNQYVVAKIKLPAIPHGATQRYSFLTDLGDSCRWAFRNSRATVSYSRNAIMILMPHTLDNLRRANFCRAAIERTVGGDWNPPCISYEPLPENERGLLHLLAGLSD